MAFVGISDKPVEGGTEGTRAPEVMMAVNQFLPEGPVVNTYLKINHCADLKMYRFLQKKRGVKSGMGLSGICNREVSTIIGPHLPSPFWAVPFSRVLFPGINRHQFLTLFRQ